MIDLGLAEPWEVPERTVARPRALRIVFSVVSVLLLASLGGGGRPETYEPVFRLRGSIQEAALAGDTLAVMTSQPARLRAYQISDGHLRWSRDLRSQLTFLAAHRDLLFVTEYGGMQGAPGLTTVLDARTGRQLWQRTDLWILTRAGDRLVSARSSAPIGSGERTEKNGIELSGMDARTGEVVWTRDLPPGTALARAGGALRAGGAPRAVARSGDGLGEFIITVSVGSPLPDAADEPSLLYELGPDGMLHTRDPATGTVIASTRLEVPPGPNLTIMGRVVLVGQEDGTIWASDLAGGKPLWRSAGSPDPFGRACGEAICLDSDRTIMVDPATGVPRYEFSTSASAYLADGRVVLVEQGAQRIRLVDPATGHELARLAGWSATGMFAGTRLVAARGGLDEPVRIAVVDLRTGRQRIIAQEEPGFHRPTCTGSGHSLVCWNSGSLAVWSVGRFLPGR